MHYYRNSPRNPASGPELAREAEQWIFAVDATSWLRCNPASGPEPASDEEPDAACTASPHDCRLAANSLRYASKNMKTSRASNSKAFATATSSKTCHHVCHMSLANGRQQN